MFDCCEVDQYGGKKNIFKCFPRWIEKFRTWSKNSIPCLHQLIFAEYPVCYWPRVFLGFLLGAVVGIVFYEFILTDMAFGRGTIYFLGVLFTLVLAVGCAASSQIRCITFLTIPSFSGKSGRQILQALIISSLVTGPIVNICDNIEEIMRMYTCSNEMAYNLSQARYNLLIKPFKMAFLRTKVDTEELKDMLGSVNNVVEPFKQEIEGEDDIKFIQEENDYMDEKLNDTKRSEEIENKYRNILKKFKRSDDQGSKLFEFNKTNIFDNETAFAYQQQYYKKLETRCESVKTGMGQMCKKRFAKFKEHCEAEIHWTVSWAICWVMKLDIICDIVKLFTYGSYDCDPSSDVSGSIGEGYVKLLNSGRVMKEGIANERSQYKLVKPPNLVHIYSMYTITKEFAHTVINQKTLADTFLSVVKTALAFMFLMVIKSASNYHNKFIKHTDFDNFYITVDFRMLDARRRKRKLPTLLPQTKPEKNLSADPYHFWVSKPEQSAWGDEYIVVIAVILLCTAVVIIDAVLVSSLAWIRDNLEFSYQEHGAHSFKIDVEGIGFVASIVRNIIKDFNFRKEMKGEVTNRECLPIPKYLAVGAYVEIYGPSIILIFLAYCEGYIKRLRRAICAYYYREQEKKRIETLYRKTLAYRQRLLNMRLEELYDKAKTVKVEGEISNVYIFILEKILPLFLLEMIPGVRPKCVTCEDTQTYFRCFGDKHIKCIECDSAFCTECWTNFYYKCFVCSTTERIERGQMKHYQYDIEEGVVAKNY